MASGSQATGGPSPNSRKRKAAAPSFAVAADDEGEVEWEDIEELERELADLDRRVLENRHRKARRLLDNAASHIDALRPPAGLDVSTISEPSLAENDQEKLEKVKVIKSKYEANAAALAKTVKRVNESIIRSEKLESLILDIHPVFQRRS